METGSRLLERLSTHPWYVRPEFLRTVQNILELKFIDNLNMNGLKIMLKDEPTEEEKKLQVPYQKVGHKAVIGIKGVMLQEASYLDSLCGFTGMNTISGALTEIKNDNDVDHVILKWDSPGGSAVGCAGLAAQVRELRETKRVTSLVTGQMGSAAYYIGSAADEIYALDPVASVGSIGAMMLHVEQSKRDEAMGLKFTYISAGKYKTMGNEHEPLTDESTKMLQGIIDQCYEQFINDVALNRNLSKEEVLSMAEGRVYLARQAPKTMLDGIANLKDFI